MREEQSDSYHPDRFTDYPQVLSRESLTGHCYWEVEVEVEVGGRGEVGVAVTDKNISRAGTSRNCRLGFYDKSWMLLCYGNSYEFYEKGKRTSVSGPRSSRVGGFYSTGPPSSRVGVYLDHSAGVLSFYSVSDTMTLLHRVQTTFTQPLYAGVSLSYPEDTAEFCKLK